MPLCVSFRIFYSSSLLSVLCAWFIALNLSMFPVGVSGWHSFASTLYFWLMRSKSFVSVLTPRSSRACFLCSSMSSSSLNAVMNSSIGFCSVRTASISHSITFETMYRFSA